MGILDTDLAALYADPLLTVPVVYGVQSVRGFLDHATETYDAGGVPAQVAATVLSVRSASLTGLAVDSAITVDGTSYRIRSIAREDDGRTTRILLAEEG